MWCGVVPASYMWGRVVPRIGRAGCMLIATCFHLAYYILMFFVTSPHIMHEIKYQSGGAYVVMLGTRAWVVVLMALTVCPCVRDVLQVFYPVCVVRYLCVGRLRVGKPAACRPSVCVVFPRRAGP
jgi:hypothetical protein